MKTISLLGLALCLLIGNTFSAPIPTIDPNDVPPPHAETSGPPPTKVWADQLGHHHHQYEDQAGVTHHVKHQSFPDGSMLKTHSIVDPSGNHFTSPNNVHGVESGQISSDDFFDAHGHGFVTSHHVGEGGKLHSAYDSVAPDGSLRSSTVMKGSTEKTDIDHHAKTQRKAVLQPDGVRLTEEKHRWRHGNSELIQTDPDVVVRHAHNPSLGSAHDYSMVTHQWNGQPQGVQHFHGPTSESDAQRAASLARSRHEPQKHVD